jgi:tetratricopeptide (TPR) repeat protein
LVERLEERLPLLAVGMRDVPERQRTLRATIEWSYELLSANEQQLFARLAVFAGGCTLEAAEQVCDASLDTLASLVDKSLLRHRERRYWMLETIREYALDRLEKLQRDRLMRALADYLLRRAEIAPYPGRGATLIRLRESFAEEADNFRAAASWALAAPDIERALRLAIAARQSSAGGLRPAEQSRWLDEGLAAAAHVSAQTQARALHAAGGIAFVLGDFAKSVALGEQSLRIFRELGDDQAAIETLVLLGNAAGGNGEYDRARAFYEEALELATRVSYTSGIYRALHGLGELERLIGNLVRASELLEKSAALAREGGDRELLPFILHGLADVVLAQGDVRRAAALYRQGLKVGQDLKMGRTIVYCVAGLAVAAAVAGEAARAGRLWGALEVLEHETGTPVRGGREPWYEEVIASCSEAAPIAFVAAAEAGRQLTPAEIIDYAHGQTV